MNSNKTDDPIDRIVAEWRKVFPALDPNPLEVVGRVLILAQHLEKSVSRTLEEFGLSLGQFDILATLRRKDPNGGLSPSELLKNVALSSGGMTARLDKLEEAQLINRKQDPNDRRMLAIQLTDRGRVLIEAAIKARFAEAQKSLPPFDDIEMETFAQLLRRWLVTHSGPRD
jgi:DNA-binding MarR family transcriptional regulator